jgi:hypothetical protein
MSRGASREEKSFIREGVALMRGETGEVIKMPTDPADEAKPGSVGMFCADVAGVDVVPINSSEI